MSGSPFISALRILVGVSQFPGIVRNVSAFLATNFARISHVAQKFLG